MQNDVPLFQSLSSVMLRKAEWIACLVPSICPQCECYYPTGGVFLLPYKPGSYTGIREAEGLNLQGKCYEAIIYSHYGRIPGKAFRVARASHCSLESLF